MIGSLFRTALVRLQLAFARRQRGSSKQLGRSTTEQRRADEGRKKSNEMHVIRRKSQRLLRVSRRRRRRGMFPAHSTASSDTHIALASPRGNCISRTRDPVMTDNDHVSGRTVDRLRRGVWATAPVHPAQLPLPIIQATSGVHQGY